MAIQGMLYPWHKGNIRLEPDFEEKYIEGELYLEGRIRLGALESADLGFYSIKMSDD